MSSHEEDLLNEPSKQKSSKVTETGKQNAEWVDHDMLTAGKDKHIIEEQNAEPADADIRLAVEFIINNIEWPFPGTVWHGHDDNTKQIFSFKMFMSNVLTEGELPIGAIDNNTQSIMVNELVQKIRDNTEILVQFEYAARGTSPSEVRDCHITLILQLLKCPACWHHWGHDRPLLLTVTESTPLFVLGAVFSTVYTNLKVVMMVTSKKMKHLCQFLIELCHDVGLKYNTLALANIEDVEELYQNFSYNYFFNDLHEKSGCSGVITEDADLSSALEVIINSSNSIATPWRFTNVYVHECMMENFERDIAARTDSSEEGKFIVNDKTFAIRSTSQPLKKRKRRRSTGLEEEYDPSIIPVLVYSTNKELLRELGHTPYLSIWGSKIQCPLEAREHPLVIMTNADVVWINEHAKFDGPPRAALSVYRLYRYSYRGHLYREIRKLMGPWRKKSIPERYELIMRALRESGGINLHKLMQQYSESADNLLHVTEKRICFGVQKNLGTIYTSETSTNEQLFSLLKAVINGSPVLYNSEDIFDDLNKFGIPVCKTIINPFEFINHYSIVRYPIILERLKIVRTNFGNNF